MPKPNFYQTNDISAHVEGNAIVANTLGDLTKRECRYGHTVTTNATNGFPHAVDQHWLIPFGGTFDANDHFNIDTKTARYGEDVVLTNILGFDVQVYDPVAPVLTNAGVAVAPGDAGYTSGVASGATGAFVDLGWANTPWPAIGSMPTTDPLSTFGHPRSQLVGSATTAKTFDTWSTHYEHDGIQQLAGAAGPDLGSDGFDSDGDGVVDDHGSFNANGTIKSYGEQETSPPYPVPLRGIKVKIRCYEPDSRQVHEVNVVESFVPE